MISHSAAFSAGFVLTDQDHFWDDRFRKYSPSSQLSHNGSCRVRMFNGNWDAKKFDSGAISGLCDGISLESATGLLQNNIPAGISLTSGLGAYWDSEKKVLTLISSSCTSRKFFYRMLPGGVVFSSDLRLLITDDDIIDPVGASQLIAYGSTGANRSLFSGIGMIGLGMAGKFSFINNSLSHELVRVLRYEFEHAMSTVDDEKAFIENIHKGLQQTLASISKHKIAVMLSGGTDSGLIACILKEMGVRDVQLFTCGFTEDHIDVQYARKLAKLLGYSHHLKMFRYEDALELLDECPLGYSTPFGDYSSLLCYFLVKQVVSEVGPETYILDGNGGDDFFGWISLANMPRNNRIWNLPSPIKHISRWCYENLGLWKHNRSVFRAMGLAGSSVTAHPVLVGLLATRWIDALNVTADEALARDQELLDYAKMILADSNCSQETLLTSLQFINICGGQWAAKVSDPARSFGCAVELPFMWPIMVKVGFDFPFALKLYQGITKYPLKKLLMRYTPEDYAIRPKTGPTPPLRGWLQQQEFNQWFLKAVADRPLLGNILCKIPVDEMVKVAFKNPRYLPAGCYHLLWTVAVTEKWFADARHSFSKSTGTA